MIPLAYTEHLATIDDDDDDDDDVITFSRRKLLHSLVRGKEVTSEADAEQLFLPAPSSSFAEPACR